MPNYDFQRETFTLEHSEGEPYCKVNRESLSALATVLSAALNADVTEMPVAMIEDMIEQIYVADRKIVFAKRL